MRRFALCLLLAVIGVIGASAPSALAQYKNSQFGFEGGYMYIGERTGLRSSAPMIGLRGAYKITDHWWLTARAALSPRGDVNPPGVVEENNTVFVLQIVPVEARYYFLTDFTRPFVGVSNSAQFLFNARINSDGFWGPGATAGIEFRLRRDMFIGFQADAYWQIAFGVPDGPLVTATTQINFFM